MKIGPALEEVCHIPIKIGHTSIEIGHAPIEIGHAPMAASPCDVTTWTPLCQHQAKVNKFILIVSTT